MFSGAMLSPCLLDPLGPTLLDANYAIYAIYAVSKESLQRKQMLPSLRAAPSLRQWLEHTTPAHLLRQPPHALQPPQGRRQNPRLSSTAKREGRVGRV
jgi:hypothetical protein